jgi:tagatose-6-phosphate ketose/aldose isomerase
MTASFTNMVVAGLAIGYDLGGGDSGKAGNAPGASPRAGDFDIDALCSAGEHLIETAPDPIVEICREDFTRAVFLGDGANYGAAKESHLKLQELTSGHVMCSYDSFLGLRHGPEAVIDEHTLVVALLSEDPYRRKYEQELLTELHSKQLGLKTVAVCSQSTGELDTLCDYVLEYDPRARLNLDDPVLSPVTVIPGQLLGLFKSLELGLQPDNPSAEGVIHRVVEGVTIYDPGAYYARNTFEIIAKR